MFINVHNLLRALVSVLNDSGVARNLKNNFQVYLKFIKLSLRRVAKKI